MTAITHSEEETLALGERLAKDARPGTVFALTGDLGAGKTVLARGIAKGLGLEGHVTSPTFTILQVYEEGRLPFYHFDVYRIGDVSEMEEIGFDEYLYGAGVSLIEWAELVAELLPADALTIRMERVPEEGDDARRITITP